MMTSINYMTGNLLEAKADALVNTVNTQGVMGKGVALQFKRAFPANYKAYKQACDRGQVQLGKMFVFDNGQLVEPRFIVNFPTKAHWRSKSRLASIAEGLNDLVAVIQEFGIKSIAVPALGCGNGGLRWSEVKPLIEHALGGLKGVTVIVYPPQSAPAAAEMPVASQRPKMTRGKAAMLAMLSRYEGPGLGVTSIEVQKLMYFLQVAGEPLRLAYKPARYGPYAENLNHVLQAVEGHFLQGYGDRSRSVAEAEPIELLAGAKDEAEAFLASYPETIERLDQVVSLIEGFESPYGLELLATVHWVAQAGNREAAHNPAVAVRMVKGWSDRKSKLFTDRHITIAWNRLLGSGWLN